jgi:hypothetical protein
MFLENNIAIKKQIDQLTVKQPNKLPILIAVAYWGKGSEQLIDEHRDYKVICNLTDGGTNPHAIKRCMELNNVQVHHLHRLHAKVVIGEKQTIIGSANFSENGLGYGSADNYGQIEAAIITETTGSITDWFSKLWEASTKVTEEDILNAEKAWNNRIDKAYKAPIKEPKKQLQESELFESDIHYPNKIRMASRRLVRRYLEKIEPDKLKNPKTSSKRSVWSPAQAANFLWVLSGNEIETNIEGCRKFTQIEQVIERMIKLKTTKNVLAFLEVLSTDKTFSVELNAWASIGLITLQKHL